MTRFTYSKPSRCVSGEGVSVCVCANKCLLCNSIYGGATNEESLTNCLGCMGGGNSSL